MSLMKVSEASLLTSIELTDQSNLVKILGKAMTKVKIKLSMISLNLIVRIALACQKIES